MLRNLDSALGTHKDEILEYGIKEVSYKLNKKESTYYAELRDADGYKLGVREFFKAVDETKCDKALRRILSDLGKVCFNIPSKKKTAAEIEKSIAELSALANEACTNYISEAFKALIDGKLSKKEAQTLKNRVHKAIAVLAEIIALCDTVLNK